MLNASFAWLHCVHGVSLLCKDSTTNQPTMWHSRCPVMWLLLPEGSRVVQVVTGDQENYVGHNCDIWQSKHTCLQQHALPDCSPADLLLRLPNIRPCLDLCSYTVHSSLRNTLKTLPRIECMQQAIWVTHSAKSCPSTQQSLNGRLARFMSQVLNR